jgi:hypothetical protein
MGTIGTNGGLDLCYFDPECISNVSGNEVRTFENSMFGRFGEHVTHSTESVLWWDRSPVLLVPAKSL